MTYRLLHRQSSTALTLSIVHMRAISCQIEGFFAQGNLHPRFSTEYYSICTCPHVFQDSPKSVKSPLIMGPTCILRHPNTPNIWPVGLSEISHLRLPHQTGPDPW